MAATDPVPSTTLLHHLATYLHILSLIEARLLHSPDNVDPTVGVHQPTHGPHVQGERSILKLLLHLTRAEEAQVAAVAGGPALRVLAGEGDEVVLAGDLGSEGLDVSDGLILRSGNGLVSVRVVRVAALGVLLQQVADSDLRHYI